MNTLKLAKFITEKLIPFGDSTFPGMRAKTLQRVNLYLEQFQKENIRPVRFFCQECGKELFEGMNLEDESFNTLKVFLHLTKMCDDCLMDDLQESGSIISSGTIEIPEEVDERPAGSVGECETTTCKYHYEGWCKNYGHVDSKKCINHSDKLKIEETTTKQIENESFKEMMEDDLNLDSNEEDYCAEWDCDYNNDSVCSIDVCIKNKKED